MFWSLMLRLVCFLLLPFCLLPLLFFVLLLLLILSPSSSFLFLPLLSSSFFLNLILPLTLSLEQYLVHGKIGRKVQRFPLSSLLLVIDRVPHYDCPTSGTLGTMDGPILTHDHPGPTDYIRVHLAMYIVWVWANV